MRCMNKFVAGHVIVVGLLACHQASAVVLYSSAQRNTSPPGSLTNHGTNYDPHGNSDPRRLLNSGWQWTGTFGDYTGTAIAPQYFITAAHAGAIGPTITVNGTAYNIDTNFNQPGVQWWVNHEGSSDLRIFKITGTFPTFAPLYTGSPGTETNQRVVAYGRGVPRGAEVRVGGVLKGWQEVPFSQGEPLSWGENTVNSVVNAGAGFGLWLQLGFDRDGGPNECFLTDHDSAGSVFIQDAGQWKLAGVIIAREGPYRFTETGTPFNASIFDAGGLWRFNPPQFVPDGDTDIPALGYATLISSNVGWINSVIGTGIVPEPGIGLALIALIPLLRRR